jgi:hypothetical protein
MCKSVFDVAARALRREFGPTDQLYRDHLGHRVLMDLEGSGEFRVERTTVALQSVVDGRLFEGPSSFSRSLLLSTTETGSVAVAVRTGGPSGKSRTVKLPFEGCGWVTGCSEPFKVDGLHEWAPAPDEFLAVPFFLRVEGTGEAEIVVVLGVEGRLVDSFDISDEAALKHRLWRVQNISKVSELNSSFADGTTFRSSVASHLNSASWTLKVPEGCQGLRLRRTYDRFHGRQRARVLVDGQVVGWWYDPGQDRVHRWAESEFGIQGEFLAGRSEVVITIDPPAGAPLWSIGRMETFAFTPA